MDPYNVIYPDEIDGGESAFFFRWVNFGLLHSLFLLLRDLPVYKRRQTRVLRDHDLSLSFSLCQLGFNFLLCLLLPHS